MKCGSWLVPKKPRKNSKRVCYQVTPLFSTEVHKLPIPEGAIQCDGEIVAHISATIDGYGCSCCSMPSLEINYFCNKCGNMYFGELPYSSDGLTIENQISEIFSKGITAITEEDRCKLFDIYRKQKADQEALFKTFQETGLGRKIKKAKLGKVKTKKTKAPLRKG